jgi:hypothetical protein
MAEPQPAAADPVLDEVRELRAKLEPLVLLAEKEAKKIPLGAPVKLRVMEFRAMWLRSAITALRFIEQDKRF